MEGISDIKIVGIDTRRPPQIRKEPYIDLYFRFSHKAPLDWCQDFTAGQAGTKYSSKINADECLYIQTWVRTPVEIAGQLEMLKKAVTECSTQYIRKIEARARDRASDNGNVQKDEGPQAELNRIVARLNFDK